MSALCTLANLPVVDLRLNLPRVGVWHADVSVSATDVLAGKVTLTLDGIEFAGTVRRGGVSLDAGVYRIVGGAGGMNKPVNAKAYNNATVKIVLQDILDAGGEKLSSSVDAGLLAQNITAMVTRVTTVGVALNEFVKLLGDDKAWRILPDGTLWIGTEAWPVQTPAIVNVSTVDTALKRFRAGLIDGSMVLPGTCFQSSEQQVSYVKVETKNGSRLEAEVWLE